MTSWRPPRMGWLWFSININICENILKNAVVTPPSGRFSLSREIDRHEDQWKTVILNTAANGFLAEVRLDFKPWPAVAIGPHVSWSLGRAGLYQTRTKLNQRWLLKLLTNTIVLVSFRNCWPSLKLCHLHPISIPHWKSSKWCISTNDISSFSFA